jgi:hypothetical protein
MGGSCIVEPAKSEVLRENFGEYATKNGPVSELNVHRQLELAEGSQSGPQPE